MSTPPKPVIFKHFGAAGPSPTQRTLAFLRKKGYRCGVVERRNPKLKNVSHDLFGIIDIIAISPAGVMGVQSTGSAFNEHYRKLTLEKAEETVAWLRTPKASLMLIGWRKVKGDRKTLTWAPRIKMILTSDVKEALLETGQTQKTERLKL